MAVIVDIDGTLADCSHRLHHIKELPQRWDNFYGAMDEDVSIKPIVKLVNDLYRCNYVILMTGRPEEYKHITLKWLSHNFISYHDLFMRANKDHRPDYVIKKEMLERARENRFQIDFAIDDSPAVVNMFNDNGVLCLAMPRK